MGGILSALAVLLQAAPVFLPVIGLVLSPFSTLPVALAAAVNIYLGLGVLLSTALLLMAVSIQEAAILFFSTGILGVVMGGMIFRKGIFATILASAVTLSIGMLILTYMVAVPGFTEFADSFPVFTIILIFLVFSFVYAGIWSVCFRRFAYRLFKLKLF